MTEMKKTVQQKKTDLVTGVNLLFGLGFLVCVVFFLFLCLLGGEVSLGNVDYVNLEIYRLLGGNIGIFFSMIVFIYFLSLKNITKKQKKSFIFGLVLFLLYLCTMYFIPDWNSAGNASGGSASSWEIVFNDITEVYSNSLWMGTTNFFIWLTFCLIYCLHSTFKLVKKDKK